MSDLLDKLRRRNLKVRELQNKYELGLHPFLKPENAMIYNPGSEGKEPIKIQYGDSQQSANTGSLSASDGVSKSGGDEDAKTETSHKKKYFDDFEYNDVLDDLYCKPFMDDEDWISSDEENDEERKNRSDKYRASNLASEDAKGLSDTSPNKSGEDSSSEEEETKSVNPEKVNWFKFIFSKHVKEDDPAYETLNSSVVTQTILSLLISDKTDEQIQEGLFENLGFEKIDMITEFISKRQFIKEYCEVLSKQINKEKRNQGSGYNPHQFSTGVTVSYGNKKNKKGNRNKKAKQGAKGQVSNHELLSKLGFSAEFIEENYKLGLKERNQNAIGYVDTPEPPRRRAQVFTAHEDGRKMGYKRDQFDEPDWTEIHLTPPARSEARDSHEKIQISELPKWAQQAFSSTTQLNTIQSIVFDCAFNSSKNVLVAAPTGAGKTNIALLTILREVKKYINTVGPEPKKIDMTDHPMKIVYLAPLKALAAEIVDKFTKALSYLKIKVREMTGDISLTKAEMKETHIIVSTPEKWDVVTRKSENVMNEVNLMIIDEIHLLNDERGTVLECLVSRALTTLIRNQKVIRILGLSATLPNYIDVADFIAAREDSTFYFDPSYRPTPLRCRFYGVKDYGSIKRAENVMNDITYQNIVRCLKMGKQVLVFVHKRNATSSTAQDLIEILRTTPKDKHLFDCENAHKMYRKVESSKNNQLKELFPYGFGIHHAGMQREERNLSEKLFAGGHIKVLCTTATLAWGVNLPAYCTIIKGTQIYDNNAGEFKDIGIFDVQQIFGRAGRPQFDVEGEGIICTTSTMVDHYVQMMSNEQDIESHLEARLDDCLNAEIAIGTVTNITEAIQWLKLTYFWIRLQKNPRNYGVDMKQLADDPTLNSYLFDLVNQTSRRLNSYKLIKYFDKHDMLSTTDMGRIASGFYVNAKTMDYFIKNITLHTPEEQLLVHMAHSEEFEQIRGRPEEEEELSILFESCSMADISKDEILTNYGKTLILLESYLRGIKVDIADLGYIVQNSARVMRALFDFCQKKNFAKLTRECLKWCKLIDRRMSPEAHPLRQFTYSCNVGKLTMAGGKGITSGLMPASIVNDLERARISLDSIFKGEDDELIKYHIGGAFLDSLYSFVKHIPQIDIQIETKTLTRSILEVHLTLFPKFIWSKKWNGRSEPFWIIISNGEEILTSQLIDIAGAARFDGTKGIVSTFFVPYEIDDSEDKASSSTYYEIDVVSDRWIGVDFYKSIYLEDIEIPEKDYPHTKLLPLKPLPLSALQNPAYERLYSSKFQFFNPVQTQVFHNLYHNDMNVLIGAPTSSGKTIMSELAILRVFNERPDGKIIYVAPMKALAKERIVDWKRKFQEGELKKTVVELTGDFTPDIETLKKADLIITTPEKWDGISRNWQHRDYVRQVALVILDEIHLLGQERGPVIEVIVSRFRYIIAQTKLNVRIVGLSTALANAKDVADWLGISKFGLYNFKPSVRPVPIDVYIDGFPEKHYCPRMATMNKPTYKAIMTHAREHPTLIFVSSRRQTRLTALDLIALISGSQLSGDTSYKACDLSNEEVEAYQCEIDDENLKNTIQFGIGMHHAGLTENDRKIVEHLFVNKRINILVTTSTLAWGVNFPARLVVIKGTEYFDAKVKRYVDIPVSDILQMMGRAGRPQFDDKGIACIFVAEEKKNFYKKFLYEPFPVESSLPEQLVEHLNAEIAAGTLNSIKDCLDYMTWTYFFRRLTKNPSFYNLDSQNAAGMLNDYLMDLIKGCLTKLEKAKCIEFNEDDGTIISTSYGYMCSFYYIFHETICRLSTDIKAGMKNPGQFISMLTENKEFAGLPVRHNEDVLNEALAVMCPIKVHTKDYGCPHVKSNLLLQAHFSRVPLPITDYITDTKSVLDQAVRVVQCMIDVSAHKGYLDTTLNLLSFQQMIIQGSWHNDSALKNVPFFSDKIIQRCAERGIFHLCQLQTKLKNLSHFLNKEIKAGLSEEELKMIYSALARVPIVNLNYYIQNVNSMGDPTDGALDEGSEAIMTVSLERKQAKTSKAVVIKSFPKPKDAGWFILVGNPIENELLALKRTPLNKFAKRELQLLLPDDFKDQKLKLYLISDAYIGIDQTIEIDLRKVSVILEQIASGQVSAKKLKDQKHLVKDVEIDSDEEHERNELSDSDYDEEYSERASDISDDLIEEL